MTVRSVTKDPERLTLTLVAEFDATPDRVWTVWSNPRHLERWWGPPTWPATFSEHSLAVGGHCAYFMTGPDGDKAHGWWRIIRADAPHVLEFEDGFADENGAPNTELPTMLASVLIEATDSGTLMTMTSTFESADAMGEVLAMGAEEGMTEAMGQIDALLAG